MSTMNVGWLFSKEEKPSCPNCKKNPCECPSGTHAVFSDIKSTPKKTIQPAAVSSRIDRLTRLINELQAIETYDRSHIKRCRQLCDRGKHLSAQNALLEKEYQGEGGVVTHEMWKTHTDSVQKWCTDCENHIKQMLSSESISPPNGNVDFDSDSDHDDSSSTSKEKEEKLVPPPLAALE